MLPYYIFGSTVFAQEATTTPQEASSPLAPSEASVAQTNQTDPQPSETAIPVDQIKPEANEPVTQITDTPVSSETPVADTLTPTPLPSLTPVSTAVSSATPSASDTSDLVPTPGPIPAPSIWKDLGLHFKGVNSIYETINNVEVNKDYAAPQNDKVKINFTKLSETAGKLTIKEIKLSPDQIKQLKAASDTAYDITSTMADGTFAYDLTLPLPEQAKGKKIEIKSAESSDELSNAASVNESKEEKLDTVTIKNLNHFTIFIITTPDPDTVQRVLINEVVPNPASGPEWVELFNNSTQAVNLALGTGWTIRNSNGDTQSLSSLGTIPAAGRVVFEAPANWLSNTAPETITLSNELGTPVDTVTISLTSPGFAIDHYPLVSESVGRKTDGVSEWVIFTILTKGTANVLPKTNTGLSETGPVNSNTGFPSWYKDSNGLAIDLMEAADGFGISDPVDPGNPFSEQIGFNAEGFWWSAEASIDRPIGTRTILVLAVEAAFAGEAAVDGEQSVQNRLRYRIDGLVPGETYTITHPFGDVKEVAEDDGTINVTDDIGCFAGGGVTCNQTATPNFTTALNGQVGPFLTWDTFNTNPALTDPQLINPANPNRRYVGNPALEHIVTGSPTGNNFFRVQGKDVGGPGVNQIQTNLFAVSGRLADTNAPVITLNGSNPVEVIQDEAYTDSGAEAIDDFDGNVTSNIITTGLPIDTGIIGAKTVTYTVSDRAGNTAAAQRTVNVVAVPVIIVPPAPEPPLTPALSEFSSTTSKGNYKTGDLIDITANFDKPLDAESTMTVELSNGVQITLNTVSGSNLIGIYTVGTNISENSDNLTVAKIISSNIQSSTALPSINLTGIVVDIKSGQVDVDSLLELDSGAALDLAGNLIVATTDGVITIGGLPKLLSIFSNGDLVNQNLTLPQIIGDKLVIVSKAVRLNSGPSGSLITLSNKNLSTVKLSIVSGTTVLGESSWNGKVNPPSTITTAGTAPSGFTLGNFAIELGYPEGILLFDQPVTILLSGINGPQGYKPSGSNAWVKMANCLGTFDSPIKPVFPGECVISNGADTKIYTYHLTSFANLQEIPPVSPAPTPTPTVTPTPTATPTPTVAGVTSSSSSSSNNSSTSSAPVCSDSKPGSAPILLSAVTSGPNQVTLTWSKAADPVSHYAVVYGLTAGNPIYGNPNVGGKDTTSYVVNSLSGGTTYYFKVRAGNGCNGSEYSNELSAAPGGGIISQPAQGFTQGVLGAQIEAGKQEASKEEAKLGEAGVLGIGGGGIGESTTKRGGFGTKASQLFLSILALTGLGFGYRKFFNKA